MKNKRRSSSLLVITAFTLATVLLFAHYAKLVEAQPRGGRGGQQQGSARGRRGTTDSDSNFGGAVDVDASPAGADNDLDEDTVIDVVVDDQNGLSPFPSPPAIDSVAIIDDGGGASEESESGRGGSRGGRGRRERGGGAAEEVIGMESEADTEEPSDEVEEVGEGGELVDSTLSEEPVIEVMGGEAALDLHNEYRSRHQVGSLGWSGGLEDSARLWAIHLAADDCSMYHSADRSFGENLAIGHPSIEAAVQDWYNEVASYDFEDPGFSSGTGHFTQIVWRDTSELGCATAICPEGGATPGRLIHVCHYSPFGNVLENFEQNVFPAVSE